MNPYQSPTHCEPRRWTFPWPSISVAALILVGVLQLAATILAVVEVVGFFDRDRVHSSYGLKVGGLESVVRESVDVIEVNHMFCVSDEGGITKHIFSQLLFRDWNEQSERFEIRAWRMMKPGKMQPAPAGPFDFEIAEASHGEWRPPYASYELSPMVPQFCHETQRWVCHWDDGGIERVVTAPILKTSFTTYDPEVTERETFPKENRRELRSPKTLRRDLRKGE